MRSGIGGRRFKAAFKIDRNIECCRLDLRLHDVVKGKDRRTPEDVFVNLSYRCGRVDTLTVLR